MGESSYIGDVLLLFTNNFNRDLLKIPVRMGLYEWKEYRKFGNTQIKFCPSNNLWKGYPFKIFESPEKTCLLIGEIYTPDYTRLLCTHSEEIFSNLNGRYIIFIWDKKHQQWHIFTDRLGTIHAYFLYEGNKVSAISTFFSALAKLSKHNEFDLNGLLSYFTFGFFLKDATFYKNIKILQPASHYVLGATGDLTHHKRYWFWEYKPNTSRTYKDTLEEMYVVLKEICKNHTKEGNIALPISGGLDSRTLAGIISKIQKEEIHSKVIAYSYGYSNKSIETQIAKKISTTLNFTFEEFTIRPYLFNKISDILHYSEGFADITQARQMFILDYLRGKNVDTILGGHWGDVWLDAFQLTKELTDISSYAYHKLYKPGGEWFIHNILPLKKEKDLQSKLLEDMKETINTYLSIGDTNFVIKAFKTDQWGFRWTNSNFRVFHGAALLRLPFYDNRFVDFIQTVPSYYLTNRQLQIDFIKRYFKELAKVEWQPYRLNLYNLKYFKNLYLPVRIVKKLRRIITKKQPYTRNWEVQFLNEYGKKELYRWLVTENTGLHSFVEKQTVKQLLDEFYSNPTRKRGYIVSMLLTFAAWLKYHA